MVFLEEKGKIPTIHGELPGIIAKICVDYNVRIHTYVIFGVILIKSKYQSKAMVRPIQRESSNYTIIRPSVVFGYDDNFFINQDPVPVSIFPNCNEIQIPAVYVLDLVG